MVRPPLVASGLPARRTVFTPAGFGMNVSMSRRVGGVQVEVLQHEVVARDGAVGDLRPYLSVWS